MNRLIKIKNYTQNFITSIKKDNLSSDMIYLKLNI